MRRWSEYELALLERLFVAGHGDRRIAQVMGRSIRAVRKKIAATGLKEPGRQKRRASENMKALHRRASFSAKIRSDETRDKISATMKEKWKMSNYEAGEKVQIKVATQDGNIWADATVVRANWQRVDVTLGNGTRMTVPAENVKGGNNSRRVETRDADPVGGAGAPRNTRGAAPNRR